jgi:hypothetical protein
MRDRIAFFVAVMALVAAGCGDDGESSGLATSFVTNQRVIYSDGLHSENTEMIRVGDRLLLIFRGGESGQVGSGKAHINVFESADDGRSFTLISEVNANSLPDGRDIRDPKLVEMDGQLFLYAISRLPGAHYRDLFGQAWTVRAESTDGGHSWTAPVKTFADVTPTGRETYWGFWRFTKRRYAVAGEPRQTLYATGYNDGDIAVGFFVSDDGISWRKLSTIINSYDDVPSEAELQFFGDNSEKAVALVRLDNQSIIDNGQTAICTSTDPFTSWECGRRIEQRLDGPTWIVRRDGGQTRSFVFARKHLPCTFKRTAIYELRGDLSRPGAAIEVCEIQEVKSSGDTAYTSLAPLTADQYLLAWYTSPVDQDPPWLQGQFEATDIWLADVDFSHAPAACVHPAAKRACEPAALPADTRVFDVSGTHLLSLAPVIWPQQMIFFRADVSVHGTLLDFTLQPLDAVSKQAVGSPWSAADVAIAADGSFAASFGVQSVPAESYPLLNDPFLTVYEFTLTGKTTSANRFCGNVSGYAQVLGDHVSDRVRLEASTFGATRISGDALPTPVSSCSVEH